MNEIVYVDENDREIGSGPILDAYQKGLTVRISRVFLLNDKLEMLIQRRSDNHKSMPGRWDQTAAGHVDKGETYDQSAERELAEEMGIKGVNLKPVRKYYSEESDDPGYIKRRFNFLYSGVYNGPVKIDKVEVSDYKWISFKALEQWMKDKPEDFTQGFIDAYSYFRKNRS